MTRAAARLDGPQARQQGVSIVEALVALIVLSVGMLGIAALFLESVQANRSALSRTIAVQLVNDIADRIRANRDGRGSYAVARSAIPVDLSKAVPDKLCVGVDCTPQEVAAFDLFQWYTAIDNSLPKGATGASSPEVLITFNAGATSSEPDTYVVFVAWKEPGSDDLLSSQVELQIRRPT